MGSALDFSALLKPKETRLCGKRLKIFLLSSVLVFLSCFSPFSSLSYAEVRLTDEEASQLLNEIRESKEELNQVKTELTEAQKELSDVNNTYSEQKTYYEEQLAEAEKREKVATYLAVGGMTASMVLTGVLFILIFL